MAYSAITVDDGRDSMISYFRNSSASTQTNKFYLKEFRLLTGISGATVSTKVWDNTGLGNDISQYLLTDGSFAITNRTQVAGKKLRLQLTIPTEFDTGSDTIDGVAIILENEDEEELLFGYATFDGFNKVSGVDLTLYFDDTF